MLGGRGWDAGRRGVRSLLKKGRKGGHDRGGIQAKARQCESKASEGSPCPWCGGDGTGHWGGRRVPLTRCLKDDGEPGGVLSQTERPIHPWVSTLSLQRLQNAFCWSPEAGPLAGPPTSTDVAVAVSSSPRVTVTHVQCFTVYKVLGPHLLSRTLAHSCASEKLPPHTSCLTLGSHVLGGLPDHAPERCDHLFPCHLL